MILSLDSAGESRGCHIGLQEGMAVKTLVRAVYRRMHMVRGRPVDKVDFKDTYSRLVHRLKRGYDNDKAMELAVGGDFEAVGILELETLKHFGLKEHDYLIDVGCGSGRLSRPLSKYLKGNYLGTDIVPGLVEHARRIVNREDWRFELAEGLRIPEKDEAADMVCFFSVFTHLLHEQSYVYLQDAKRVLKKGGKIVFSFLDFTISDHWRILESNVRDLTIKAHPLNMFISKDAIGVWAQHLGLSVSAIHDGDKPYVPLSRPVVFEDGSVAEKLGSIGQSVCVLEKTDAA